MEQKEHIAACQSSQQDNWADSCAQKNREIWSDRAPLICFLSKSPKQSTRPEAPGAEEWLKCYLLLWSSCVPANLLGFCFRLDSPLLGAVFHFTAPILPLQPPRCAAVRVCFQLLVMSSADPPWNQPTPFCQELETHPRSHTKLPSFIKGLCSLWKALPMVLRNKCVKHFYYCHCFDCMLNRSSKEVK